MSKTYSESGYDIVGFQSGKSTNVDEETIHQILDGDPSRQSESVECPECESADADMYLGILNFSRKDEAVEDAGKNPVHVYDCNGCSGVFLDPLWTE